MLYRFFLSLFKIVYPRKHCVEFRKEKHNLQNSYFYEKVAVNHQTLSDYVQLKVRMFYVHTVAWDFKIEIEISLAMNGWNKLGYVSLKRFFFPWSTTVSVLILLLYAKLTKFKTGNTTYLPNWMWIC